ncbi:hypothetical protein DFR79_10936 [Halanaerobium saccharolyticum]|uniref:Uncharacterized protein n=1 Tax=Halanaerobium saccharolyticum TaxID=43595 RepID=A0A4R6LRR7_9FIRM|nr:hypothetical protein [Halanaerobium saccharolyticum]TDO91288.1 hypothetical protein DFR79_10936 [Halanaerobium saccharolyticum]
MKLKIIIMSILIFIFFTNPLIAAELENYYFQTSFYTHHYSQKDYQNNEQQLIGLEKHFSDNDLYGIAFFDNTYEQESFYLYKGTNYNLFSIGKTQITAKFTYGIVHGYDDENGKYDTWMHDMGTFPGAVFSFGLHRGPFRLDIVPFADAGILIIGGVEF